MPIVPGCTSVATEMNCYQFLGLASVPNYPLQVTRPMLRFRMNVNSPVWGRAPERETLGGSAT
jgi:hypothetical protein